MDEAILPSISASKNALAHSETDTKDYNGCDFASCGLCSWTATVFRAKNGHMLLDCCPICLNDTYLSFISLAGNGSHRFTNSSKLGLETEFASNA
jgi:hypothetical protein